MAHMYKTRSVKHSSRKRKRNPKTVEEYVAAVPELSQSTFDQLRAVVRAAAPPDATEIVSYGIPALKTHRVLVWYAAFSRHCSLFPKNSVIEKFKNELKDYSTSKGTIQFPLNKPLPTVLIKKIVKARVAESESE